MVMSGICMYRSVMLLDPSFSLVLGDALDILTGVVGLGAAAGVLEVKPFGSLVQSLLIASGIAVVTVGGLLDHGGGGGIILLLADDLLHTFHSFALQVAAFAAKSV